MASAVEYLNQFVNYEQVMPVAGGEPFSLRRMESLMETLWHPERQWASIHVAGTKGKGSTCAMLASILQAAGYRVGLYTSPHLVDLRERIQIDGIWIADDDLADAVESIRPAVEQLEDPPTFFEVLTAAAFWWFAWRQVQVAVIEVGLGGRLDATNVLDPLVSVLTPISYDHTALLGTTLQAIASEKAGIIKPFRPVVVAPQHRDAWDVIRPCATRLRAPCVAVDARVEWQAWGVEPEGQHLSLATPRRLYPALYLPLLGSHQAWNLATAVTALEMLPAEWMVKQDAVLEGVARVSWPGRFQIVDRHPWVVLDGAQNAASALALRDTVRSLWPDAAVHLVVGMSADKDVEGVAEALRPLTDSIVLTQASHPRAMPAARLAERFHPWFPRAEAVPDAGKAVDRLRARASDCDVVVITGSLFLVGEQLVHGLTHHA